MSNRKCNYCEYKYFLGKYPNLRKVNEKGGVSIYNGDTFIVWFMELSQQCCC